jgi:hypothetical protein
MGRTVEVATGIRIFFGGAPGGVGSGVERGVVCCELGVHCEAMIT